MWPAITAIVFLFISFENVFCCSPCKCREGLYSIVGHIKTGDCWTGRISARIDKIPDNFDTDIGALEMSGQSLTHLKGNELQRYEQLQVVNLHNCNLKKIPLELLTNISQLVVVWLSDNKLTTLQSYLFKNLSNLQEISLDRNKISVIEDNCFFNLPALELLSLSSNSLKTLNLNFDDLKNLKHLRLAYNQWICDKNLCDLIFEVVNEKSWDGASVPTCSNLKGKRWDQLEVQDMPLLISSDVQVNKGENLTLQCKLCAPYATNFVWTVNYFGRKLNFPPEYYTNDDLSSTSTITLNNITSGESGIYTCRLENCEDCQSASTYVSVSQKNENKNIESSQTGYIDVSITTNIRIKGTDNMLNTSSQIYQKIKEIKKSNEMDNYV